MKKLSPGIHYPTIKGVKRKVRVLASGQWKFMKMPKKGKSSSSKTRRSSNPKPQKRRTYMTKKKKRGGGKSLQRTIFKLIRVGALAAPLVNDVIRGKTMQQKAIYAIESYTGYNMDKGRFDWRWLARGWTPFLAACLATYGIPKIIGIIRKL